MAKTRVRAAEQLLTELYNAGTPFLREYPWEFESDRWAELLICSLTVAEKIDAELAREIVGTLKQLGLTAVAGLSSANASQTTFIRRIFMQHGCSAREAERGTKMLVNLARAVSSQWNGYVQRLLRTHGQRMADELSGALKKNGMSPAAATKVAVLWLQNVANIPLLLPQDGYVRQFCETHGISTQELIDAADRLGLNVSILDDLLALEASAAATAAREPARAEAAVETT